MDDALLMQIFHREYDLTKLGPSLLLFHPATERIRGVVGDKCVQLVDKSDDRDDDEKEVRLN